MPSMHYLKREISLSKACMARCSQSASAPSAMRAWGFSPMATSDLYILTDESASMRPQLSLSRECASRPAEHIAHASLGIIMKDLQGSLSNRFVYNPKQDFPVTDTNLRILFEKL
jgi:hypothetical protein